MVMKITGTFCSNCLVLMILFWLYDSELPLLSMLSNDVIVYAQSGMTNATQECMIRGRRFGGVAVFIRKSFCHLTSLCAKDDYGRVVCVKFMSASLKMLLFVCYFPCNNNSFVYSTRVADVIGFIDCVCSDFPDNKVCVLGDLNFEFSSTDVG